MVVVAEALENRLYDLSYKFKSLLGAHPIAHVALEPSDYYSVLKEMYQNTYGADVTPFAGYQQVYIGNFQLVCVPNMDPLVEITGDKDFTFVPLQVVEAMFHLHSLKLVNVNTWIRKLVRGSSGRKIALTIIQYDRFGL